MPTKVIIDGKRYRPVDEAEAAELERHLREFRLEATTFWRHRFMEWDKDQSMYEVGDEEAPFFSEAFLYNLIGKDEARTLLHIMRSLCALAGVKFR